MNQETTEQSRGLSRLVPLKNLYLDPNNFRFVDQPEYREIPDERVFDEDVQRRTMGLLLSRSRRQDRGVQDLIESILENGWIEMEPILVQRGAAERYLVIEGNRRVATLKHLQQRYEEDAMDLRRLDPAVFSRVWVALFEDADARQRLVMMGLQHISGKERWPPINRGLAMKQLLDEFDGDADAVRRTLGVSRLEFRLSVLSLPLVEAYRHSEFGDQFHPDQYHVFREILRSRPLRDWLEWDGTASRARNEANLRRLFTWMSRDQEREERDETDGDPDGGRSLDPIIRTGRDIRELSRIIGDRTAVRVLEETRSLQEATLASGLLVETEIEDALESCEKGIRTLLFRAGKLDSADLDRIEELNEKLRGVVAAPEREEWPGTGTGTSWPSFNEIRQLRFSSIRIEKYRGIGGVALDELGSVNLIVGVNNAGKTSLLEAVHLLAHQNDERSLFDTIRWRSRIEGDTDPVWLAESIPEAVRISGKLDASPPPEASLKMTVIGEPDGSIANQTGFLRQIRFEGSYNGQLQSNDVVLFEDRRRRTHFDGRHWLCRAELTSPFSSSRPETLARCNKESVKAGTKEAVIGFIRENVDPGVRNIELVDKHNRFRVVHDDFPRAPDLASFGEGMRRVFEIGLLFAGARGGVLLIDEFENAIHTELLSKFTGLVRQLAEEFKVQVFLTTHSKEAIDAWVTNGDDASGIVGYALVREDDGPRIERFDGEQLRDLHEVLDFDLRGVR